MRLLGIIFAGLLGLAALVGIGIALDLGGLVYQERTAEMRGQSNAERQIESAAARIAAYEKFHDLCAAIQAREDAMDAVRANTAMDDARKANALTANQTQRASLIAEYNADSRKDYTAARFKDSDLPWALDRAPYDGTNPTSCTAD